MKIEINQELIPNEDKPFKSKEESSTHGNTREETKDKVIPNQTPIIKDSGEDYNFDQYKDEFNPLESEGSEDGLALLKENENDMNEEEREIPKYNHK